MSNKCQCGCREFVANQVCYHEVLVGENGEFLEDCGIYDSNAPYAPFECRACGKVYEVLEANYGPKS